MEKNYWNNYRQLSVSEIKLLEENNCSSLNWELIQVENDFDCACLKGVTFQGECYIATQNKSHGEGIFNSLINSCIIGSGVRINNVSQGIYNYQIGKGVIIENVRRIAYQQGATCGLGTAVSVLDEMGSRSVPLLDCLTAPLAYIFAFARHKSIFTENLFAFAQNYVNQFMHNNTHALIADNSFIADSGELRNIYIKQASTITDSPELCNCVLQESEIKTGTVAHNLVAVNGSIIEEHSTLHNCFVGEASHISGGFSAHDSLIFSNCSLNNGEVAASILGPHSVSSHRATLLVGCCASFFNAGSGTNQSNHHYKLGPMHYGIMERGCKTGSNSYILWPGHIGAFSKVIGSIDVRPDLQNFPLSVIAEKNSGGASISPGIQLATIGLLRDVSKWKHRDKRKPEQTNPHDVIDYRLLAEPLIFRIMKGYEQLKALKERNPEASHYTLERLNLSASELTMGITCYRIALIVYLLQSVGAKTYAPIQPSYDLLGACIQQHELNTIITQVETGNIHTLECFTKALYDSLSTSVPYNVYTILELLYPDSTTLAEQKKMLAVEFTTSIQQMLKLVENDARGELTSKRLTGFGLLTSNPEEKRNEALFLRSNYAQLPILKEVEEKLYSLQQKIEQL